MPTNPETIVREAAVLIREALTRLGFAYELASGEVWEISYKSLELVADRYALLEVDTQRLPRRVRVDQLTNPQVLHHLTAVVGREVKKLNTTGLTYCLELQPPPRKKPFPQKITLPDEAPADLIYPWPFGVSREGTPLWADLLTTGALLVGGKSGSGKSTFINAGLVALIRKHTPATLRLALVDPKTVELWPYSGIPHLVRDVATTPEEAAELVEWLVGEMERRETVFKYKGAKDLTSYNRMTEDPLPLVLAVIDEITDLVVTWGGVQSSPFGELIRLSSKSRAFGIVLCIATQNPKAVILDTLVRENSGVRVSFKVDTYAQSRSILAQSGAEKLPANRPGRLVTDLSGRGLETLQGFLVPEQKISELVDKLTAESAGLLTEIEAALVAYAQENLAGAFPLQPLYDRFKGSISWRQLTKLGRRWETRGWLTKPVDAVSPRLMTDTLLTIGAREPHCSDSSVRRS